MLRILLVSFLFLATNLWAQDRTISGTVSSEEDGSGLPGVNVILQGTTTGTTTDIDGNFRLDVPTDGGVLVFSFIGLSAQEIEIGTRSVIDVVMSSDVEELQEVVVTALGITKEKAALGYAVTSVGGEQLEARPEADIARLLRGKVPGVDITSTSGIVGTGTNIIIRGHTSISGSNQPLFVLDGVPIDASTFADRSFSSGGSTSSSRFLDLDPNNVADVSVLKGLAATVLYGEAGRNGVILITTKTGSAAGPSNNKKVEVTFNQSYFVNEVASMPDDQDNWGNGWQNYASGAFSNWGAPLSGGTYARNGKNGVDENGTIKHPYDRSALHGAFPELIGARWPYQAYDNLQNFFVKGSQKNSSIGIAANVGSNSSIKANYGWTRDEGYVPNNNYTKHNFSLGSSTQLSNGLKINSTFNYVQSETMKPMSSPIYSSNPSGPSLFSNVLYTPRSWSLTGLPNTNPTDNSSVYYRPDNIIQHPYWTIDNTSDRDNIERFIGNIALSYEIADFLNVTYRLGLDHYNMMKNYRVNKGGPQRPDGEYQTSNRSNTITDQQLNLNGAVELSADLDLDFLLGANLKSTEYERHTINSTEQFVYNLFTHNNFITTTATSYVFAENTYGAFANISLGYKDWAFLSASARNDWTSTLEPENRAVLYPSASISVLPFEAAGLTSDMLNYLKIRVGYGTSAGYPSPYSTRGTLDTFTKMFQTAAGSIMNSNAVSNFYANPNLKPEIHKELELGIEGRFWKNRIGIDVSLYTKDSEDLIIDLELDPSTGYTSSTVNSAAINNKGIEAIVNVIPVQTQNFTWDISANFTLNRSEVTKIADGIDQVLIAGASFLGNFAKPGLPYNMIWGAPILRYYTDPNTTVEDIPYDQRKNYSPVTSSAGIYQYAGSDGFIGDPNPDYIVNVTNTISYKWISLRAQVDHTVGGDIWGGTASTLTGRGILEYTGFDRFVPVVVSGVDKDGNPNKVQVTPNAHYWRDTGVWYDENRIFDASTIRLREVSLSLVAPKSWLNGTPFGRASLTFSGQNLWHLAYNFPASSNMDPEVLSLGVGNGKGFDRTTGPTSKKWGATLSFTF